MNTPVPFKSGAEPSGSRNLRSFLTGIMGHKPHDFCKCFCGGKAKIQSTCRMFCHLKYEDLNCPNVGRIQKSPKSTQIFHIFWKYFLCLDRWQCWKMQQRYSPKCRQATRGRKYSKFLIFNVNKIQVEH